MEGSIVVFLVAEELDKSGRSSLGTREFSRRTLIHERICRNTSFLDVHGSDCASVIKVCTAQLSASRRSFSTGAYAPSLIATSNSTRTDRDLPWGRMMDRCRNLSTVLLEIDL
jgi:hypothetical protein